jgi:hypothetical protein
MDGVTICTAAVAEETIAGTAAPLAKVQDHDNGPSFHCANDERRVTLYRCVVDEKRWPLFHSLRE